MEPKTTKKPSRKLVVFKRELPFYLWQFSKLKRISAEAEPAGTIRDSNSVESILNRIWKSIQRPRLEFTKESLHLRPKFFIGIQIRTIRWKINVSNTGAVQQIFYCPCMVRFHIIHYENRIAVQMRQQISFQIPLKPLHSRFA